MTEAKAEILGASNDGRAFLAKMNLKPNPATFGDDGASGSRESADRALSHTVEGRAILKRRGFSPTEIERMQRPS